MTISSPRILFVLNDLAGGASLGVYEMLRQCPRGQMIPYLVAPDGSNEDVMRVRKLFCEVRLLPIPWWNVNYEYGWARRMAIQMGRWRRGISFGRSTHEICRAIEDWKIDLVHSGTSLTVSGALAAAKAAVPHVWHVKETIGVGNRVQFPMCNEDVAKYMGAMSRRIVVMSQYIGRFFSNHHECQVAVIPDGVDAGQYGDTQPCRLR